MSSIYVMPVEIRDDAAPAETFWLEALLWVWDISDFSEVVENDLKSRGCSLVNFGEARDWHDERHSWPDNGGIEQMVTESTRQLWPLWCKNRVPIAE